MVSIYKDANVLKKVACFGTILSEKDKITQQP